MPTIANQNRTDWTPKADFEHDLGVTHADFIPKTAEELAWLLEDSSALPEAEVYRDLDQELYHEIVREAASVMFPMLPAVSTTEPVAHEPRTEEELSWWLEDAAALPEAEVYADIDRTLYQEIVRDAAERIFIYVRGGDLTAQEATEWYLRKQTSGGHGGFSVQEAEGVRTARYIDHAA